MSELRLLIIGSSIAGLSAAEAARAKDKDCQITILSEDAYPPYYRQRLCEVLEDPHNASKLYLHPESWYTDLGIDLRLGQKVRRVRPSTKDVLLEDGSSLAYDKLIIATGSYSFIPPTKGAEFDGVETLWTMEDALRISAKLDGVKSAVVVGGGLLGLEAAFAIGKRGVHTAVLERLPRLMMRQLDERSAEIFTDQVRKEGSEVETNAYIAEIYADEAGKVEGVRLEDGHDYAADLVMISTGVRPRLEMLEDSGVTVDRFIVVDEEMRTNVPDIYAAGDCAIYDNRWYGLWMIGKQQGAIAGENAVGGSKAYEMPIPPYMVNTMGTRIASAGLIEEKNLDSETLAKVHAYIEENLELFQYAKKIYTGESLSGFVLLGDTKAFSSLNKELSLGQN